MVFANSPLDIRLQRLLTEGFVTGASVAYVRKDSIEIAAAGLRDKETAAPVNVRTVFPVASLTKPIVVQLFQFGFFSASVCC